MRWPCWAAISMTCKGLSYATAGSGPYLCLDADENGSGPRAARLWSQRLGQRGLRLLPVALPEGYDPNRFFAEGGSAAEFSRYLQEAER